MKTEFVFVFFVSIMYSPSKPYIPLEKLSNQLQKLYIITSEEEKKRRKELRRRVSLNSTLQLVGRSYTPPNRPKNEQSSSLNPKHPQTYMYINRLLAYKLNPPTSQTLTLINSPYYALPRFRNNQLHYGIFRYVHILTHHKAREHWIISQARICWKKSLVKGGRIQDEWKTSSKKKIEKKIKQGLEKEIGR